MVNGLSIINRTLLRIIEIVKNVTDDCATFHNQLSLTSAMYPWYGNNNS